MSEPIDENEFSYSFWIEQHRIMQEKRDALRAENDALQKSLKVTIEERDVLKNELKQLDSLRQKAMVYMIEAFKERDALKKQLEVAKEAMKSMPHNVNHTKHGACHGCEMNDALAEIDKLEVTK